MKFLLQTLFFFLLTMQICFGQWTQVGLSNQSIKDIAVQNSNIFAVTSDSGKVFRSIDNGSNWTMIVDSCARDVEISLTGKVFMIKDSLLNTPWWETSIYSSLDNGETWTWLNVMEQLVDSIEIGSQQNITISPAGIVLCGIRQATWPIGFWTYIGSSADDGVTWTTPGTSVRGGSLFDFKDQFVITIGEYEPGMPGPPGGVKYLSSDFGNTWTELIGEYLGGLYRALDIFSNGNIIIGGEFVYTGPIYFTGVLLSTDMCSTWSQIASLNSQVGLSWSSGSKEGMIIGTDIGVFLFSDEGDSLGSRNEVLTNLNIQALTLDNNGYVYAGTENGVWRRPLTEVTSVEENQIEIPSSYNLSQNFPNPFNPSTRIKYSVPYSSQVTIKVFDVLGNKIATLLDEEKSIGTYELTWNAVDLPSGVYFYQLKVYPANGGVGSFVETKKMILIK